MKQVQGSERIDRGAIDYFSQVDVFVWSMGHGEHTRTVSIRRDSLSSVEAYLQQAGTHLKSWCVARDRSNAARKRCAERFLLAACGRLTLLQCLLLEVLLGIDAPVDREPALLRHHIEVRPAAALSAQHQNRLARLIRSDVKGGGSLLHFLLQLLQPPNDLVHALERVFPLVL